MLPKGHVVELSPIDNCSPGTRCVMSLSTTASDGMLKSMQSGVKDRDKYSCCELCKALGVGRTVDL